ncbi:MAG: oxidoreductase [Phycisphaerales bacterium]|nr:oxidoreductase [Phycisphaerales bacterium]
MDLQLKGKTALVTGSTAGIGLAIATSLAGEGATVYINGRKTERVDAAIAEIKKTHPKAELRPLAADLSKAAGVAIAVKALPAVDILINNLGIFEIVDFDKIKDEDWTRFFETNVMSGVRMSRAYLPAMLKKNWGRIVFISSESAFAIPKEMIHYGMTKSAQVSIARGLAELTQGTAVTVNSVLPGPTHSEGLEDFVKSMSGGSVEGMEEEFFKTARPGSLIKRFLTTKEIGDTVTYVCSPLASGINGAAIRNEGGLLKSAF